ncbi:MAG: haloacid dehalogenase-like hydrolase, partial [Oscillospiraceae bacterium]|nr:haloacid dehalogenase-like hydrolase [Oscillospiraceae bacterium]
MAKRLLDCSSSDLKGMTKEELLYAIAASEGRVLASETIGTVTPLLGDLTNAELAAALGADVLLLNIFDVDRPQIQALPPVPPEETVREVKRLTGRPVGINLEPVEQASGDQEDLWRLTDGRRATLENGRKAADMGV